MKGEYIVLCYELLHMRLLVTSTSEMITCKYYIIVNVDGATAD